MSTYVMSDIHGHFDEFLRMLELIEFSDRDELIIAGDYVDRGPKTLEMLRWIEESPENVILLKGNHDAEFSYCINFVQSLGGGLDKNSITDTKKAFELIQKIPELKDSPFFDYYGTIENLIMYKDVTLAELKRWVVMIRKMPFVYRRRVNGKKFIIVHAGYLEDDSVSAEEKEQFYLYARENAYTDGGARGNIIVAGHTPTIIKGLPMYTGGEVFRLYDEKKDCVFYDIDCGCGYKGSDWFKNGRLACIRLEDEQIFYI